MDDLIRITYLLYLYNTNCHIHEVRFIDKEVEITYADNSKKSFVFQELNSIDQFKNKLKILLDTIMEVNERPSHNDNDEILKVKYEELYSFSSKYMVFNN
jgi:hypothetical protein